LVGFVSTVRFNQLKTVTGLMLWSMLFEILEYHEIGFGICGLMCTTPCPWNNDNGYREEIK
jgi:hypothetical protein